VLAAMLITGACRGSDRAAAHRGWHILVAGLAPGERTGSQREGFVTCGIPLPRGQCTDPAKLSVVDDRGQAQALQTRVLSRWPDGSVKWVLLTFYKQRAAAQYILTTERVAGRPSAPGRIEVVRKAGEVVVRTGPLELRFSEGQGGLFDGFNVFKNGESFCPFGRGEPTFSLKTADGKQQTIFPVESKFEVEEAGPLRAVIKVSRAKPIKDGDIDYYARIYCYAGQPYVRVDLTFINCSDPGDVTYKNEVLRPHRGVKRVVSMPFTMQLASWVTDKSFSGARFFYKEYNSQVHRLAQAREITLYQGGYKEYVRTIDGMSETQPGRLDGWLRVGHLAFGCREFWQQFPKAFSYQAEGRWLTIDLCRASAGDPWLLNPGVAKTHQLVLDFGDGSGRDLVLYPLRATLPPEEMLASRAMTPFGLVDEKNWPNFEQMAASSYPGWLKRAANGKSPGILHYGDPGGNGYHHPDHDLMLFYFRTGDPTIFEVAAAQARHRADIDIMHYPPRLRGWHHTEYTADHWDPRAPYIKPWIAGLYDYYCLTGDRRALDALTEVGDLFARDKPRTTERNSALPLGWIARIAQVTDKPEHWQELRQQYEHCRQLALNDKYTGRMFSVAHLVDGLYLYWTATGDDSAIPAIVHVCKWFYEQTGEPSGMIPSSYAKDEAGIYYWAPGEIVSVAAQAYEVTGDVELLKYGLQMFDSYLNWYGPVMGWYLGAGAGMHQMQWACQQAGITEADIHVEPWGGFQRAIQWLKERLGKGGDDASLTIELARTLTNAGRYDEALAVVEAQLQGMKPGEHLWRVLVHAKEYIKQRRAAAGRQ